MDAKNTSRLINRLTEPSQNPQLELQMTADTSPIIASHSGRTSEGDTSPAERATLTVSSPDSEAFAALSKALIQRVYSLYREKNLAEMYEFYFEIDTLDYPDTVIVAVKDKLKIGIPKLKGELAGTV